MNLTQRQQEIVELAANRLDRALARTPLAVVPRWRLEELQHSDSDSDGRDRDWNQRFSLIVSLVPLILPSRYRTRIEGWLNGR